MPAVHEDAEPHGRWSACRLSGKGMRDDGGLLDAMSRSPRPPQRGAKLTSGATRRSISVMRSPAKRCEVAEAHAVLPLQQAAGRRMAIIGGARARRAQRQGPRRADRDYALALDRAPAISALAAGSDGIDGSDGKPTEAAAAIIIDATTLARHLDAKNFPHNNDATSLFEAAGGLLVRGHSHQRQ